MSASFRSSRWFIRTSLGFAALMVAGALPQSAFASQPSEVRAFEGEQVTSAPDEAAASQVAVAEGRDVVVDELTTEFTQVVATPDGAFEMTTTTVPVRTSVEGKWVDIDTDLALTDSGFLEPGATTVPVQFSAGGSDELARVQLPNGDWMTERWPLGDLPEPTVEGAVALYEDVLPDVDLQLTATETGMTEVLIVNTEEAADNPDLATISIAVEGASLTQLEDGTTLAGPEGEPATAPEDASLIASAPTSWDSSDRNSGPEGVGGIDTETPVAAEVQGDVLTLDVAATLDDEELVYPVYVDPDWYAPGTSYWSIVESFPNTTYAGGMDGTLPVGYLDPSYANATGGTYLRSRSFWSMNVAPLHGKQIIAAQFSNTEVWAFSCTETPVQLWQTDAPANASWNGSVYTSWWGPIETKTISYGYNYATCPNGRSAPGNLGWNVTAWVASAAASDHPLIGSTFIVGLRAQNENANNQWKRFAQQASLTVTYNTPPNPSTGRQLTSPPRVCSTSSATPGYINGTMPFTFGATATDPDAGNVATKFYVYKEGITGWADPSTSPNGPTLVYSATTPMQAQGAQTLQVPANTLSPGRYRWYSRTFDGHEYSSNASYCYITVKNTPPAQPSTTSRAPGQYTIGKPTTLRFTSTAADQAVVFAYWWVASGSTTPIAPPVTASYPLPGCNTGVKGVRYVCADASGLSPLVTVAPVAPNSTLWVATYDTAGNVSPSLPVSYSANPDTAVSYSTGHGWPTVDEVGPLGATLADANSTSGLPLFLLSGLNLSASGNIAGFEQPVLSFPGDVPAELAWTNGPAVDTVSSFSVSAWLKPAPLQPSQGDRVAISQVGPSTAAFELGESANGFWQFCMRSQTAASVKVCVQGGAAAADTWQFVTGVWDASNQQLRLYVGDDAAGTAAWRPLPSGEVSASERLAVGCGRSNSMWVDPWRGQIAHPHVLPGVPSHAQRTRLYDQYGPNP